MYAQRGGDPMTAPPATRAQAAARAPDASSEKAFAIDQLAAGQPCEAAAVDDLHVRRRGVVLDMVVTVRRQPGTDVVFAVRVRDALAVHEQRVGRHQPPVVAYAVAPASASAACAAASRASGTRNGEQ